MTHTYLSDGVYLKIDKDSIYPVILTTGHHDESVADNVIYLELTALKALVELCQEEGVLK